MNQIIKTLIFILVFLAIGNNSFALFSKPSILIVRAQSSNTAIDWSEPQRIFGYRDNIVDPPYLVADSAGTVHVFGSEWVGESNQELAIVYNKWSLELGWTDLNDILLAPQSKEARIMDVFLDQTGRVHLIFFGGDDLSAKIYYSRALLVDAGRASAWSEPLEIGPKAVTPSVAAMISDDRDNLYVIYSGKQLGLGVYGVHSSDGGDTWSDAEYIFNTYSPELWPWAMQLFKSQAGRVHAVWTVVNIAGNGEFIYHARLTTDGASWESPKPLAEARGYEVDWASLIEYEDTLLVVYNNDFPSTRWMRRSFDDGSTWSDPVRPFPQVGEYGHATYLTDSSGQLHMFLGNRIDQPSIHGIWHSVWLGNQWSELTAVVAGPPGKGFDPTRPKAVVLRGNIAFVVWTTDFMAGRNGVWYSYVRLNAPVTPLVPLITPIPSPTLPFETVAELSIATPAVTTETLATNSSDVMSSTTSQRTPAYQVYVGILPSLTLITIVTLVVLLRKRTSG